jgi:hypothetical protein
VAKDERRLKAATVLLWTFYWPGLGLGPVSVNPLVGMNMPGITVLELGLAVINPVPLAPIRPVKAGAGTAVLLVLAVEL